MIFFESIKWRNFLSTGNSWNEVALNECKSTLIVGANGAGKSTILDALCFALYGKAFRKITKSQLVNSVNGKNAEVELNFRIGKVKYRIRRGIKPNIFEIYCDEKLIDQSASSRDYQSYFEENILKMDQKSFGQVVVLGSSTFVPFMQLTAASRREVIEDLLDIHVFAAMNALLKDEISNNKTMLGDVTHECSLAQERLNMVRANNKKLAAMQTKRVDDLKEKADSKTAEGKVILKNIKSLEEQIAELNSTITDERDVLNKIEELRQYEIKANTNLQRNQQGMEFFTNKNTCPTCQQNISDDLKAEKTTGFSDKIEELQVGLTKLKKAIDKLLKRKEEISSIRNKIDGIASELSSQKIALDIIKSAYNDLMTQIKEIEQENSASTQDEVEFVEKLTEAETRKKEVVSEKELLTMAQTVLKDGGIKTHIIKQYVPVMNKLINEYLSSMDLFVEFELDETFVETIKSRHRDTFSYASFSEGEKARINLSLLLAWRDIARMRNSVSTNLLILDEVFDGSLDSTGSLNLNNIISGFGDNTNVFVISHKSEDIMEGFSKVMCVKKERGFSIVEEIESS